MRVESESSSSEKSAKMSELLRRIRMEDEGAYSELYSVVRRTVLASLRAEFGQDAEDVGHEIFIDIVSAIKANAIRKAESFIPYLRTMINRRRVSLISEKIQARNAVALECTVPCSAQRVDSVVEDSERWEFIRVSLLRLDPTKQEILRRFYLDDQPASQIIDEMQLTDTQYRLQKSRGLSILCQHVERRAVQPLVKAG
ncbi:MAG: sigma-70 family RNA polymerase sigma factor [Bryobacterales bacterium]|nr:sigma-70 family RNA polymerase sigma factor [Bryobacterales bacterium]